MKARYSSSVSGIVGATLLVLLVFLAVIVPMLGLLPGPAQNNLTARLAAPSLAHLFGTDQLGRDIFSRIVHGGRVTLTIGAAAVLLGGTIGTAIGLIAGYRGGWLDSLLMRIADVQLSIPLTLLALLVVASLGPSLINLVIVLSLTSWVQYARVVRGEVLVVREKEFIQSAHVIGLSATKTVVRHILPNVFAAALVIASIELARVIILESAMSFLGLGIQPPNPSWGRMLADGRAYMSTAPWVAVFPGLAIFLTVLAINLAGDWARDWLDPKTS